MSSARYEVGAAATLASRLLDGVEERRSQAGFGPTQLRVGMDVIAVREVARSLERFGGRYVERLFTVHEMATCRCAADTVGNVRGYSTERLAARFAAKEAAIKVLRPIGARPAWPSIEVHRTAGGWCELRLSRSAATLARQAGIDQLAVSLTHEAEVAGAVVVGVCNQGRMDADAGQTGAGRVE